MEGTYAEDHSSEYILKQEIRLVHGFHEIGADVER